MVVELISVGTEILLGNIVNTNAAYLSEECAKLGLSCYYQTVVGDNEERLTETLKLALGRADIVILGGGHGPKPDDLTKEVAAKVCGKELFLDEKAKENNITKTALITVGRFLGDDYSLSKLYDKSFETEFRKAQI